MKTGVTSNREGVILNLGSADAVHAVLDALNQFVDNAVDEDEQDESTQRQLAEAQKLITALDAVFARLAA